jgi:hypothetical protein
VLWERLVAITGVVIQYKNKPAIVPGSLMKNVDFFIPNQTFP